MKLSTTLVVLSAGLSVLAADGAASSANAAPALLAKPKAKAKAKGKAVGTPKMKKRIALYPRGVRWGMSVEQLARVYDRHFERRFAKLYRKVQPGPRMRALDAELRDKKKLIRRNKLVFGSLPTGIDQSPLKGEYSYGNNESMTRITLRSGVTRNFFFFNNKLWLIYDEHKLSARGKYGGDYAKAISLLTKRFGVAPQKVEPNFKVGRNFGEARWHDGTTLVRAIDRGYQKIIGMAYANQKVFRNLSALRKNRPADPHALDRDVRSVTSKKRSKPGPTKSKKK